VLPTVADGLNPGAPPPRVALVSRSPKGVTSPASGNPRASRMVLHRWRSSVMPAILQVLLIEVIEVGIWTVTYPVGAR
jgi:hypothetical protein